VNGRIIGDGVERKHRTADEAEIIEGYRVLDGKVLLTLDR
jgi:hypothetical protein